MMMTVSATQSLTSTPHAVVTNTSDWDTYSVSELAYKSKYLSGVYVARRRVPGEDCFKTVSEETVVNPGDEVIFEPKGVHQKDWVYNSAGWFISPVFAVIAGISNGNDVAKFKVFLDGRTCEATDLATVKDAAGWTPKEILEYNCTLACYPREAFAVFENYLLASNGDEAMTDEDETEDSSMSCDCGY